MNLVGPCDSPFVRRVAVALNLLGLPHEHDPWSPFGDAERPVGLNPLARVPALVLDDGEVLIDSAAILDHLDEISGEARLIAPHGPGRRATLRVCAMATGLRDKMISRLHEQLMHDPASEAWLARCAAQIEAALSALEAMRAACPMPFWFGAAPGHADTAVACALRFLAEAHPRLPAPAGNPHLAAHAAACEAVPAFAAAVQPFTLPCQESPRPATAGPVRG